MGKNVSPQMLAAHDNASRYIQFLLKVADSSLSQNAKAAELGKKFFTRNDIAVINMGKEGVGRNAPELVKILLSLRDDDAQRAMLLLHGALSGAFEIGTRCAHQVRSEAKAEIMRDSKKNKFAGREAAIILAVEAERVAGRAGKVILTGVNNRLVEAGYKPTNLTKVYRLLK